MLDGKTDPLMASKIKLPEEVVEAKILLVCGQKVMLDGDLAALYEVETKVLNQAVKRTGTAFLKISWSS
jgi:hypothetical protein